MQTGSDKTAATLKGVERRRQGSARRGPETAQGSSRVRPGGIHSSSTAEYDVVKVEQTAARRGQKRSLQVCLACLVWTECGFSIIPDECNPSQA